VSRETEFERVEGFWTLKDGRFTQDQMIDDQALLVNLRGRGLAIISGCAHSGIVNTVKHATNITGTNRIHALIGGFHLQNADQKRIHATLDQLVRIQPEWLYPCHCTGSRAVNSLLEQFGDHCVVIRTGDAVEL
jgi:7,8-dihydropterin-6-yl-methyl-4-(beta-D-ribofuranosyl)aminobenzene 5'-phosphate synthase